MLFRIPILVAQVKTSYTARPLFHPRPSRSDDNLQRLTTKLTRDLIQLIEVQARSPRQDEVALWTLAPAVTTHRHDVEIDLRRRRVKLRLLFVQWEQWDRKLAFCPAVPEVLFEVARGERLESRAAEVLQDHWRKLEREAGDEEVRPEEAQFTGKAWVHTLEFSARTNVPIPKPIGLPFLFLGGNSAPDGAEELRRVGRCLDWLYPDELDRVTLREPEVTELGRLLDAPDGRPILLVGPHHCGKTAIIHECVHRNLAGRQPEDKRKRGQTWLISPQRLISGMSYVGQWEGRLLAILKHARKRRHVLFFDDLLGLFHAGVTSQSTLSAATVLKPYLEDRQVRVLGEISPEQFRVLQEQDRGFADLFHVLPVREPADADLSRILISVQRRLEGKHPVRFGLDVMPTVIDLQRRYERSAAFPGKAVAVLTRLAVRAAHVAKPSDADGNPREPLWESTLIERREVLNDIAQRSGLSLAFLDPARKLDRDEVRRQLATHVIGQDAAVDAVADVVSIAKARLNDPNRPLASFLLVGPTGVGKTELAKATARTLFGDADHLVRFDLNEYNTLGSATKLVGTFQQPEGLLTAALRRQPFCVLLFDEVEKAHPDVHDVMLQVLGEGRLTDALGRTADFTNAIILLTSNLGVREAGGRIGFLPSTDSSTAYARSAERFFRPEFFNRLDRVIPFRTLTRPELAKIAERVLAEVLAREGFGQLQCVMSVASEALNRVIDAGYDPELGARAMKRAVERELTKPAATQLAGLAPDQLTIVTVRAAGDELRVDVQGPGWAARQPPPGERSPEERIANGLDALDLLEQRIAALRPPQAKISGRITPEQERYYALKEVAAEIAERWELIDRTLDAKRQSRFEAAQPDAMGKKTRYRTIKRSTRRGWEGNGEQPISSLFSALSIEEAIDDLVRDSEPLPGDAELFDLENRLALLQLMASAPADPLPVFLWIRGLANTSPEAVNFVSARFRESWGSELGVEIAERTRRDFPFPETDRVIELFGIHARALAGWEAGTHLVLPKHGGPMPVRIAIADSPQCPFEDSYGPILRVYPEGKPILDVRTGLVSLPPYPANVFRTFTLASLPRA